MISVRGLTPTVPDLSVGDEAEIEALRERFARDHCVRLEGFLDRELRDEIVAGIEGADFYERSHGKIGTEGCMEANPTLTRLLLLANDPRLFELIRRITGCGEIGCFDGRVYRISPAADHSDSWHSDMADHRMIAMSVNLSPIPYDGGALEIRDERSGEIVHTESAPALGDAVIFRLAEELRHRVMPVEGTVPRTAFAGWFKSQPDFLSVLRGAGWSA